MAKQIIYDQDAREALKRGIDKVARVVKITLGPRGRNVALDKGYGGPTITNDGVSIAKEITLSNKFENMGAEIAKEVANKTNDKAGDGTTTSIVLLQEIVNNGFKRIALGANPMRVRQGIEKATHDAEEILKTMAEKISSKAEIKQVATISAESEELGATIAETIEEVGKDGVVTVEESQSMGIEKEIVEGLEFDRGYVSAYLITNSERMEASYKDVPILITDKKISSIQDILPILEKVAQSGKKDLVIIADDVDGEALTTLIVNKLRAAFNVLAVKAPGYGDRKKEILADIAVMTGGEVISDDTGTKFDSVTLQMLGRAAKVIATKDSTIIVGGKGAKKDIQARIEQIRAQIKNIDPKDYNKKELEKRLAKLSGGVAVIRVGAATETEMKYLKLKIEDAVNATKAAIEEGIVAGGGTALVRVGEKLNEKLMKMQGIDSEFAAGYNTVIHACTAPLQEIVKNTTHDVGMESSTFLTRVINNEIQEMENGRMVLNKYPKMGYDAKNRLLVRDMFKAGIIDPVKVTRTALQNASSAAAILLTTEAAVAEEPKDEKETPMPGAMGDMDY